MPKQYTRNKDLVFKIYIANHPGNHGSKSIESSRRQYDEYKTGPEAIAKFNELLAEQEQLGEDADHDVLQLVDPSGNAIRHLQRYGKEFATPNTF